MYSIIVRNKLENSIMITISKRVIHYTLRDWNK